MGTFMALAAITTKIYANMHAIKKHL